VWRLPEERSKVRSEEGSQGDSLFSGFAPGPSSSLPQTRGEGKGGEPRDRRTWLQQPLQQNTREMLWTKL
jgi:hypothetical protein